MIKFYLVNFRTKLLKGYDLVLIGNSKQVEDYAEMQAACYGSDYFIEQEYEQLTPEMQNIEIINVCNN